MQIVRKNEIIMIVDFLLLAVFLSLLIPFHTNQFQRLSQNYAQILAELIAFVFILPQVIIQLALNPHQKDVKTAFAGCIPFYYFYYVIALLILALNLFDWITHLQIRQFFISFTFISSIFLIFPYFNFLLKEYSISDMFITRRNQIIKKLRNLSALSSKEHDRNHRQNNQYFKQLENQILDDAIELRDYVLTYVNQNYIFFTKGINALIECVEIPYQENIPNVDNILVELLKTNTNIGLKMENDASKNVIIDRTIKFATNILSNKEENNDLRINLFITKIIELMRNLTINGTEAMSSEMIEILLRQFHNLMKICLRRQPPHELEYHLVTESYKHMCLLSIKKSYSMCARDAIEKISYICVECIKKLPNHASVDKTCTALKEIGTLAAKDQNEFLCLECTNRLIEIIDKLQKSTLSDQTELCMASLLEFAANCWLKFPLMEEWLNERLNKMKQENGIDYRKYSRSTKKILKERSIISNRIFSDFIDMFVDNHRGTRRRK